MTSVNKANTQNTSRLNKRKGKVLSIDYDFFQNANAAEQAVLYPDGHDFANINLRNLIWRARYQTTPALRDITLNKSLLKELISILQEQKPDTPVTIKNSHVFAYQTVMQLSDELNKPVDVYHVDMHHDLFNEEPFHEKVDCGNWLLFAKEEGYVDDIIWFGRKASKELCPIDDTLSKKPTDVYYDTLDAIKTITFDTIFLCRSDMWSAPHLDNGFQRLIKTCKQHFTQVSIEKDVAKPRPKTIYAKSEESNT